jgi:hypothetical protein
MPKRTTSYACGCQKIEEWTEYQMHDAHLPVKHVYCEPHQTALAAAEEQLAEIRRDIAAQEHTITSKGFYRG